MVEATVERSAWLHGFGRGRCQSSRQPPRVIPDGAQHYINQGGLELVTFTPSGYVTEAGVRVGKYKFRSFPLPGSRAQRFSLFAYPWDLPPDVVPVVLCAQSGRHGSHRHVLVQAVPQEVPRARPGH